MEISDSNEPVCTTIREYKFGKSSPASLSREYSKPLKKTNDMESRKSAAGEIPSLKTSSAALNNSHPPLVPLFGNNVDIGMTTAYKNPGTVTPISSKSSTRIQRTIDQDRKSASLSVKRCSTSKLKVSISGNNSVKSTPVSTNLAISLASSNRKSVGSAQRNSVRSNLYKYSSIRKSTSEHLNLPISKFKNGSTNNFTPLNFHHNDRHSSHGSWVCTPRISTDFSSLKKMDINSAHLNGLELERREDESSSNVSVGVRVRPINIREMKDENIKNIISMDGNEVMVNCENGNILSFTYDLCLWSCDNIHQNYASQKDVYTLMARPLIDHVYEGYNVCLFAYGQTGSGKSYCIMGDENCHPSIEDASDLLENAGIIPRFCRDLFGKADEIHFRNNDIECKVVMEISYIEIYNEKIYDLVGSVQQLSNCEGEEPLQQQFLNRFGGGGGSIPLSGDKREPLRVREHPQDGPYVVGASSHLVSTYQDFETWIALGNKQRSIAATGMNDKSSRSHSVFSVKVTQTQREVIQEEAMEHSLVSIINLVDLAGSERVAASNSEGDRLKEGVCINQSLLTLGKVITALAESNGKRKTFIPYRESTLTWLLKESLGGNSKTAMIATISPCNIHQEETLSTLRYAQKARKIVNWNRINEDPTSKIIRALKLEVERLRSLQLVSPKTALIEECCTGEDLENRIPQSEKVEMKEKRDPNEKSAEREIILAKEREIALLKEKLHITQEQFTERARLWEDKLRDAEIRKKEALERCRLKGLALRLEENEPTLVSLCEDPQLSQTLLYSLKSGSTTFGSANADVTLSGLSDSDIHCSILHDSESLILHPNNKTNIFVNGKLVKTPTQIFHNDRVVFDGIYFFRVCLPSKGNYSKPINSKEDANKFDFFYAKDELLKEQEERIRNELSAQQAETRAEMIKELEEQRLELQFQEMALKENVESLAYELEEERNMNQGKELARILLQEEKQHLEDQIKLYQRLNSQSSSEPTSQTSSPTQDCSFFIKMEAILNESSQVLESYEPEVQKEDVQLFFLISEANNTCKRLQKPYHFQQESRLTTHGVENVIIIRDVDHNLSSTLDADQFRKLLSIIRDLASGEEDDNLLESCVEWEREEELSKVFPIRNKIRENSKRLSGRHSLNSSFGSINNSMNASLSENIFSKSHNNCRKSSIQQNAKGLSRRPSNPRTIVAKAMSQVLMNKVSPKCPMAIFVEAASSLIEFLHHLQKFISYYRDECPSSEDSMNQTMVEIVLLTTSIDHTLSRMGSEQFHGLPESVQESQTQFSSSGIKVVRKVARMLQGVEKEVESLVEEEHDAVSSLILHLLEEIGFLNLVCFLDLVDASFLVSSLSACRSYLNGVSRGLEWNVRNCSKEAESTLSILEMPFDELTNLAARERLIRNSHRAISATSDFLTEFSQLKVISEIEPHMSQKAAMKETSRFLVRAQGAAKNLRDLISAFAIISKGIREVRDGVNDVNALEDAIAKLQEALGDIVDDAGVGSTFEKQKRERKYSGENADSVGLFLEKLHFLAMKAFREINKMKSSVSRYVESEKLKWARDSSVSLNLTFENAPSPHPLKSSLKHTIKAADEKKVRFNVSLGTSLAGSSGPAEDGYDVIDV